MKHWMLFFALLLGAATAEAQVRFMDDSTDALREAAVEQQKLVFIDLYATWCGPCRQMEKVFALPEVGEFFDRWFVAGRYDVDRPTGRTLLRRYGHGSIPLYLVFNTEGELLGRILGASDADKFLTDLQRILDGWQTAQTAEK